MARYKGFFGSTSAPPTPNNFDWVPKPYPVALPRKATPRQGVSAPAFVEGRERDAPSPAGILPRPPRSIFQRSGSTGPVAVIQSLSVLAGRAAAIAFAASVIASATSAPPAGRAPARAGGGSGGGAGRPAPGARGGGRGGAGGSGFDPRGGQPRLAAACRTEDRRPAAAYTAHRLGRLRRPEGARADTDHGAPSAASGTATALEDHRSLRRRRVRRCRGGTCRGCRSDEAR